MNVIHIEESKISVPGGEVYVKRWMPETASKQLPMILLHDSLGSVDLWRTFPSTLSEGLHRPVIAYDRLGFGKSDARTEIPSIFFVEEEATLYFPAIKAALGLEKYSLCGHSVGGGMSINIAARDPDCQAVITMAAQPYLEELTTQGIRDALEMFKQPGQIARLERWHGDKGEWVLRAWTDTWLSPDFADWGLHAAIGKVTCPVLAIHGATDEYGSPAFPKFISEHVGGRGEMLLLEECGHMPHRERLDDVLTAIEVFLESL